MKKITLLSFMMLFLLAGTAQSQVASYLDSKFFGPDMVKQLDSIYEFSWVANNWDLKTKNYKIRNGNGQVIQDLFLKINPNTSQWSNFLRYLNTYDGESSLPRTITGQNWTAAGDWITYQYTHFLSKGLPDTAYEKTWDQQKQKFTGGNRYLYTYNANSKLASKVSQTFDTITSGWLNSTKVDYAYNANNIQTEEIFKVWVDTSWVNNFRQLDTFDANQSLVEHSEFSWIDSTSTWGNVIRDQYTYNQLVKLVYSLNQSWNYETSSWDSIKQTNYFYNLDWLLFSAKTQQFDPFLNTWSDYALKLYTYDQNGQKTSETDNIMNPLASLWIITQYTKFDSVNQIVEFYERFIDFSSYLITGGSRDTYSFSSKSDLIGHINQEWNTTSSDWVNKSQDVYTYDEFRYLQEKLIQNWTAGAWVNFTLARYYYTESQGINDIAMQQYCTFANPMKQGTAIDCPKLNNGQNYQLSLYSLSGALVWKRSFNGGEQVTMSADVANGMYILRLSGNGKTLRQDKVIVVR